MLLSMFVKKEVEKSNVEVEDLFNAEFTRDAN